VVELKGKGPTNARFLLGRLDRTEKGQERRGDPVSEGLG
jgi:hypothetical protein